MTNFSTINACPRLLRDAFFPERTWSASTSNGRSRTLQMRQRLWNEETFQVSPICGVSSGWLPCVPIHVCAIVDNYQKFVFYWSITKNTFCGNQIRVHSVHTFNESNCRTPSGEIQLDQSDWSWPLIGVLIRQIVGVTCCLIRLYRRKCWTYEYKGILFRRPMNTRILSQFTLTRLSSRYTCERWIIRCLSGILKNAVWWRELEIDDWR